jgi:hypothetical protein
MFTLTYLKILSCDNITNPAPKGQVEACSLLETSLKSHQFWKHLKKDIMLLCFL